MRRHIGNYLTDFNYIEGWFDKKNIPVFSIIDTIHTKYKICGDIMEIGAYYGKSTILLGMFIKQGERLKVNDTFDWKVSKLVSSNEKEEFLTNIRKYLGDISFIEIYHKTSSKLTLKDTGTNCRIFHIDGHHSTESTTNDLMLAYRAINSYGVIILDDLFNEGYPGVAEATILFVHSHNELVPVLIGFNKSYWVKARSYSFYYNTLKSILTEEWKSKNNILIIEQQFFRKNVIILYSPPKYYKLKNSFVRIFPSVHSNRLFRMLYQQLSRR